MMTRRGLTQQQQSSHNSSSNSSSSNSSSSNSKDNNNTSSSPPITPHQQHPATSNPSHNNRRDNHRKQPQQHLNPLLAFVQRILSTRSSCMLLGVTVTLFMGLFGIFGNNNNNSANAFSVQQPQSSHSASNSNNSNMASKMTVNTALKESRLRAALWSFFAGDALAMPSHWYYGGPAQINRDYGKNGQGIQDYTAPVYHLSGSILNKSNLSGGGRSNGSTPRRTQNSNDNDNDKPLPPSIIGYVINHGKQDLWSPAESIHYHATLAKGENTLEVQLARVLMRSIVNTEGVFDADHFRSSYVEFMTTPDSHHDTYASTCHRMFFANRVFQGRADKDCPDNDGHNVDTIDGLVLPTITALAVAGRGTTSSGGSDNDNANGIADLMQRAAQGCMATASVTRRSNILENAAAAWGRTVVASLLAPSDTDNNSMEAVLRDTGAAIGMRRAPATTGADQMTACYLDSAMPALLDSVAKYIPDSGKASKTSVWKALLNNANAGGENVHRGSCLGAVLGARAGMEGLAETPELVEGLHDREVLAQEIDDFVTAVMKE